MTMNYLFQKAKLSSLLTCILLFAFLNTAFTQFVPEWDASLGGNIWEELNSVEQTADGGFIMAGFSSSSQDGDVSGITNGGGDYWVVKTDDQGQIQWENNFGGNQLERPWQVLPTDDGGYLVAGYSPSNISGDKTEDSRGGDDYWVVKMDNTGNYQWDRTYGGDNLDWCYDMIQLNDGGFLLGGRSLSGVSGEKTEPNNGSWDYWLVKIDASGNLLWDKTLGGADEDLLTEMQLAPDGNVIIAGGTSSSMTGDVASTSYGVKDFWLTKVDGTNGDLIWEQRYGGTDEDEIFSMVQTSDGGYLLGGGSRSNANPGIKTEDNFGIVDMWIVKVDAAGAIEWDRTFGGDGLDNCYNVRQNSIGYYVISGFSNSVMTGNKTTGTNGGYDYWILYLNPSGDKLWESSLGGAQDDVLENAFQTTDGGFLLAGHSSSDVSGDKVDPSNGFNDFWIIKTLCNITLDLQDTMVCPNEPVELNAFEGTDCVNCVWTWGDSPTSDSIRLITTDVTTTYNITLTDDVGCSTTDEVTITVLPTNFNDNLDDAETICNGSSTTLNAGNAGSNYTWSTGAMTQIINASLSDTYFVTVTDNNGCTFLDSTVVTVANSIVVNLGNDTTICANGGSVTLDAGNPGLNYLWSPGMQTTQTISVSTPGNYSVVVSDATGSCSDTDEINIDNYDSPIILSSMVACNDTNTFYTVTLEITGGDVNTYTMSGNGGTFNGNIFTSVPIPKDAAYTFFLSDGGGCTPVPTGGIYDCDCSSDGGTLDPTAITVCGDSLGTVVALTPAFGDANDIVLFALHENPVFDNNTVVFYQELPSFEFQTGIIYGQTYYITTLSGNEIPAGSILLEDGCLGMSNSVPITFYQSPIAEIGSQSTLEISCGEPLIVLDGSGSAVPGGGPIFYAWEAFDGGNIIGNPNVATVEIDAAGTYVLTITNGGGCTATDTLGITDNGTIPLVTIATPNQLSCIDTIVTLDASNSVSGPEYSINWAGGTLTDTTSLMVNVTEPGVYLLTITDNSNGCSATQSTTVLANYDTPTASVNPLFYMDCTTGMVSMTASVFPPEPDYLIEWTTVDGEILDGADEFTAIGGLEGIYAVKITNVESGCFGETATTILPNQFRPRSAFLKYTFPLCLGDSNGTMRVDSVLSGTAPFEYSFNGEPFTTDTFNLQLSAGENNIAVRDAFGCLWDTTIVFNDGKELLVDLEETYGLIELGDSIQLEAVGSEDIDSVFWESPTMLSCSNCLYPWITPTADSMTIGVQLFTVEGCTGRDEIVVRVKKDRRVYIPNAFSPNGNRKNEFFSVFTGKGTKSIRFLRVYNRWGGLIYESRNLTLGDKKNGWNGNYKNEDPALPGVYIFVVEVEFLDGEVKQYRGDFTLYK